MPLKLDMSSAEKLRKELTEKQVKQIEKLYAEAADRIGRAANKIPATTSDILRQQYLKDLQDQLRREVKNLNSATKFVITENMRSMCDGVVSSNSEFLKSFGIPIEGAFSYVPSDVVQSIVTGKLYEGRWNLSRAIWRAGSKVQADASRIVAQGIAENRSAYDIAKDLEKYVNPSALKDWEWSKVYPGTNRKVDYNAQRLARTMVSHAYQQSFVRTTQKNPFVTKYQWLSSGGERMCEICEARNEQYYEKDDLPLDHPNGMCTFVAVIEDSMTDIADRLADWVQGKQDSDLDTYAEELYGSWNSSVKAPEKEYRYHATTHTALVGITEKGLLPSRGMLGKGVYFSDTAENAVAWTAETSTGGKTILRVALDYLTGSGYEEYSAEEDPYNMPEGLVDKKIPLDQIQIKVGEDEWWSLAQYASQRRLVYDRLSDAAKKRVDRIVSAEWDEYFKLHRK